MVNKHSPAIQFRNRQKRFTRQASCTAREAVNAAIPAIMVGVVNEVVKAVIK